jgi:transcriptional regulator GlxA family with amidase domain
MDPRVRLIISLMQNDLCREMTLDELADAANLSRSHFQHLFRSETGVPPAHYLRMLRLERARELLSTSLLPVKQVMASVGIFDRSHFERAFKKSYGLTPRQYRAAHFAFEPGTAGARTATK